MPKSDYFPHSDSDLLLWHDHFKNALATLKDSLGFSDADLAAIHADNEQLHQTISAANAAAVAAHSANAAKSSTIGEVENNTRAHARRAKAQPAYVESMGVLLGIIGSATHIDPASYKPILTATDQTGGIVQLKFNKYKSDGINIYCQREGETELTLLSRTLVSPFTDKRPLLVAGKPELRRYTAVHLLGDDEVGQFSDELVVNCAP
ncbi:hypothetical protein [Methylomonas albis]|uniref:Uncharacterized protein n=1 Tax=Methylomonas albis TaxID=1854563 RepID=A0ABR9D5Y5_9GAMM|nr:hypothetical protein [Methylomonas albis]MBD9358181.1 hypothetical protein [Methylomonas albis]